MKKIPVNFFIIYALLVSSGIQAQNNNGAVPANPASNNNNAAAVQAQSLPQSSTERLNKQTSQVQYSSQPYLQDQRYLNQRVDGQNYYSSQPYLQDQRYSNQPFVDGQNYTLQSYAQEQRYSNQPYVQGQNYPNHVYVQEQRYSNQPYVQGQNYPTQGYVQDQRYSNQPYVEGQSYPTQGYVQEQQYAQQPYVQGQNYPSRPSNYPNEALGEGQWYPADTYPQPPIYSRESYPQQQSCQAPQVVQHKPPRDVSYCNRNWSGSLEVRVAGYFPISGEMRKIYDSGVPFYQAEATYSHSGPVSLWFNAGYLGKNGRSRGEEDRTYFRLVPIGLGLNYSFYLPYCWKGYVGAGPTYSFLTIHDHSDFNRSITRNSLGGIAKLGLIYEFWKCVQVDFFVDYYYTKFHFSGNRNCSRRNDLDASAIIAGAGLGWAF